MRPLLAVTSLLLGGCGLLGSGAKGPESRPRVPEDPTPLARCKIAASASSPLVTEWPASEKAHLESLSATSAVAVEYSGCELKLIDSCKPAGRYAWRRTTLATDALEVTDSDELWAKLPLGAASLEGELARSGRLVVKTTVAGQLALEEMDLAALSKDPGCAGVTHVVSAISVGAFAMSSGGSSSAGGGASVAGVGTGAKHQASERVMRTAGNPDRCGDSPDGAPHQDCASPVQLFLRPVGERPSTPEATPGGATAAATRMLPPDRGISVVFPGPEAESETWTLHDENGLKLCTLPCTRVVPKASGYYLERSNLGGHDVARVELPSRLPFENGSNVTASYRAERGSPFWSKLTFYGLGIPMAALSIFAIGMGISSANSDEETTRDNSGFWYGISAFYLATAAGTYWWFAWSHDASFDAKPVGSAAGARRPRAATGPSLRLGPGFVSGSF